MAICQRNFMTLESRNKKMGLVFCMSFLFHFSRNSFLYYFMKVYVHEKLEVKQNETSKNLAPHQDGLGITAVKEQKVLPEHFSLSTAYEKQVP